MGRRGCRIRTGPEVGRPTYALYHATSFSRCLFLTHSWPSRRPLWKPSCTLCAEVRGNEGKGRAKTSQAEAEEEEVEVEVEGADPAVHGKSDEEE